MKKTIFLLIAIFAGAELFSQTSTITIFTQDGEKFWLVVDGEKINKDPQTKVKVENLTMHTCKFKVLFQDPNIPAIDQTMYAKDVDNNFHNSTYVIKKNEKNNKYVIRTVSTEIVTTTTTTVTSATPASTNTTTTTTTTAPATTNTNQNQTTTYQQTTTTTGVPDGINMGVGVNINESPDGVNMNVNMGGMNVTTGVNTTGANTATTVTSSTTTTTTTTSSGTTTQPVLGVAEVQKQPATYVHPGYSGPTGCPRPMLNEDFAKAKSSISSKSFEDSKLTIAKQIVGSNCLLCSQVKEIMQIFSFEDTKLQFAKFAYKYTFDINNYYQLNDAFNFESSIDELNEYINGVK